MRMKPIAVKTERNLSLRKQNGATLIEYGLIVALIALVCIAAVTLLGTNVSALFSNIAGQL